MNDFNKPLLVSSKCIEFAACRYDGAMIKSTIVEKLKDYVEFITICPEVEVGLGIPRDPIRLVEEKGVIELVQPSTGKILTNKMKDVAMSFLDPLPLVDGFILKNKSPSCGIKAVKVYPHGGNSRPRTDGVGIFAEQVYNRFYQLPVEDEGRLRNSLIRESFFSRIFTLAEYRHILKQGDFNDLIEFHTNNKLLLLSHNQAYSKEMGRTLSNRQEKPLEDIKKEYGSILLKCLSEPSSPPSNVNVLQHAFGYVSDDLNHNEKQFFLDTVQKYREGKYPLIIAQNLLQSWILRFNEEHLSNQTFFEPYPNELMEITFI